MPHRAIRTTSIQSCTCSKDKNNAPVSQSNPSAATVEVDSNVGSGLTEQKPGSGATSDSKPGKESPFFQRNDTLIELPHDGQASANLPQDTVEQQQQSSGPPNSNFKPKDDAAAAASSAALAAAMAAAVAAVNEQTAPAQKVSSLAVLDSSSQLSPAGSGQLKPFTSATAAGALPRKDSQSNLKGFAKKLAIKTDDLEEVTPAIAAMVASPLLRYHVESRSPMASPKSSNATAGNGNTMVSR